MKRKSPQVKKALSYKKDRRNTYGENSKASRKGIPRKKRRQARAERRLARTAFPAGATTIDVDRLDDVQARLLLKRRKAWVLKFPDEPLGEVLAQTLEHRAQRGMVSSRKAAADAHKARRHARGARRSASSTASHGIYTVALERCGKVYRAVLVKKNTHEPTA
jgi:hypothetical protein